MTRASESRSVFNQRGSVAIEYAIVLPVLLLFVLGIIDVGRLLWTYSTLYRASEAAARCFAIQAIGCTTSVGVQAYAVTQAWGLMLANSAFSVTNQTCGAQVSATFVFAFVIPWINPVSPFGDSNSIMLGATACYPT